MSDAGDEIQVEAPAEVEAVVTDAPKGKLSLEDALQVSLSRKCSFTMISKTKNLFFLN